LLDQGITRHQTTVDGAAARFERRQAATHAIVDHALQQQQHAHNLANQLRTHRDHIDGIPSAADIRRAATRRQQLQGFATVPEPEPPVRPQIGPDL
jgi:hypothetical protein